MKTPARRVRSALPTFHRLAFSLLACAVYLGGCATLEDVLRATSAAPAHPRPAMSAPSPAPLSAAPAPGGSHGSHGLAPAAPVAPSSFHVDFRILEGRVTISRRGYVLDAFERPVITPLGGDVYQLEMKFRRDSKNSFRGDETIVTKFYYDGVELIFFWDANNNNQLDRYESNVRYVIDHKQEIVAEGDRRFARARKLTVHLAKEHTNSAQSVRDLALTLLFQAS